jgi:hypothetical protein
MHRPLLGAMHCYTMMPSLPYVYKPSHIKLDLYRDLSATASITEIAQTRCLLMEPNYWRSIERGRVGREAAKHTTR